MPPQSRILFGSASVSMVQLVNRQSVQLTSIGCMLTPRVQHTITELQALLQDIFQMLQFAKLSTIRATVRLAKSECKYLYPL